MLIRLLVVCGFLTLALGCGAKSTEPVQLEHSIVDSNPNNSGGDSSGETGGKPRGRTLPPPQK